MRSNFLAIERTLYKKIKMSTKFPKNSKFCRLKIHQGARIERKPKTFLNKGTKYKKNYMEGLNSRNKQSRNFFISKKFFFNRIAMHKFVRFKAISFGSKKLFSWV